VKAWQSLHSHTRFARPKTTLGQVTKVILIYMILYANIHSHMPELSQFTAEFFKALAHPMRVRILDTLRSGEVGVNELSSRLKVEQSTLSQQLAVLRKSSIVVGRKEGQNVYYSVPDQAIFRLLDDARQVFNNQLVDIRDLLSQLSAAGEK
jgi:DNA-binding transcriptional ArsR family regulator